MARYSERWEITVSHDGLNKFRVVSGPDKWIVEEKARRQQAIWDDQWERKQANEKKRLARELLKADKQEKRRIAQRRSDEAIKQISEAENLLKHTLSIDDAIDWDELKSKTPFSEPTPKKLPKIPAPVKPASSDFDPKIGFFDIIIPGRKKEKNRIAREKFSAAVVEWQKTKKTIGRRNQANITAWEEQHQNWEERKKRYESEVRAEHEAVNRLAEAYKIGELSAIEQYVDLVLSKSSYPDWVPREWQMQFESDTGRLLLDLSLPEMDAIPNTQAVRYIQVRDSIEEKYLSKRAQIDLYDSVIYQIIIRTIHEVFESDRLEGHIGSIVLNGIVEFIDPATGKSTTNCIATVEVDVDEFSQINLEYVEPKACFKALKGVSAAKLDRMASVPPLAILDRSDRRFVNSQNIAEHLVEGDNLAAMDWQEFEHLIRQVFEYEFSTPGSEVRVTQGSRDGGVDAIAFDPDPIRGGKIVIQAKRYTNTVGVDSVRDLYGTVMAEGATKGILVTTSQYGPDARKFATGKPLTLIDGPNLLYLLGKSGIDGHIDLKAAKAKS